eukprot:TRINITY_DN20052_c0_g1_i1.p1 TRINITY_DN20052_c0_g1~~TRINITY_DN20052_c0_g1_i1.p1  ORF type:complete len:113 (-),score=0.95 TRINITY_DN20052_c0_g1_i1:135-473(-)
MLWCVVCVWVCSVCVCVCVALAQARWVQCQQCLRILPSLHLTVALVCGSKDPGHKKKKITKQFQHLAQAVSVFYSAGRHKSRISKTNEHSTANCGIFQFSMIGLEAIIRPTQ